MYGTGVSDAPPPDFATDYKEEFPNAPEREVRAAWVSTLIMDEGEAERLVAAITGQTMPTESGVNSAAATFRRNG